MTSLSRELVFLILQFLEEEKFKESVHKLEKESGFFFNMKYFEEKVQAGEWEEVEKYLAGFTKVDDNRYSMKIFFEIRKQKYLEALDRQDKAKAVEILVGDLKVFSTFNEELYKEITQLLTLTNFRENEQLSKYGDTKTARGIMLLELKKLIEANPLFRDKLIFPTLKSSRLRTLINQSLNWQHQLCKNPRPNPDIKTLFIDHSCTPSNGPLAPTPVNLPVAAVAKPAAYTSLGMGAHGPFPPAAATANANALAGWMANASVSSSVQAAVVTASTIPVPQNQVSIMKRPRTPSTTPGMVEYQNADHDQLMKRLRPAPSVEEVSYPSARQASWSLDDLPRTLAMSLHQGSSVTSMDFHPSHQTLLLVGSNNGEISLWELGLRERLVSKPFKIWDISACSLPFQAAMVKDTPISVRRVTWSHDGSFVGVAFTKHLIHIYAYNGSNELAQRMEIDAHIGAVNDLAFAHPNKQLCIVTCGDDKLIKVWDLTGRRLFNFEGHEAPVYSICPHHKENIQFIFSTAIDGKIKAWLYDNMGSRVDYDAPGHWCTTMLYSADGTRLFSCGTSKDGESFLVEWNESEGAIKRTYNGFRKKSAGVVQFDTTQNRFLAAGEDGQIKFWDMDNINLLTSIDAEGGLQGLPHLRFNKEGNLLAVSTADNGFKILANAGGLRSLKTSETPAFEALRSPIESAANKVSGSSAVTVSPVSCKVERSSPARPSQILNGVDPTGRSVEKPRTVEDVMDRTKSWQLSEIVDPVHCRLVTMPDSTDTSSKVVRLLYTNSGAGLLALGSNGVQKLWKWSRNDQNPSGKATASVVPQHWQPNSGLLMTNDVSGVNLEEAVPCIALSKNDSYVMSACGGKISLFNMMTFKVMTTFMPPPPASTYLAFHPQDNNIIAIGMEDSTIHIYNVRVDEVKTKLKGHQKRISGLAFSTNLGILVSSGADAHLCVWSIDSWEKRKAVPIQLPAGKAPVGETRVQFHSDQLRLLVAHETQLAIYDASKMERIRQWVPQDVLPAPISYAAYSCNSQLIYATFCDGNTGVFDADSLRLRCRIAPSTYFTPATLNGSQAVYPFVVAAHPLEPNQFALGLTDGSVKVIEPNESEGKWGTSPPMDNGLMNGRTASSTTSNHTPDQGTQR
jgi:WD40 repeat protein